MSTRELAEIFDYSIAQIQTHCAWEIERRRKHGEEYELVRWAQVRDRDFGAIRADKGKAEL
jgi:hypothetical protein